MWSRFNQWYLASPWHRLPVDAAFIGLMFAAWALIDHHGSGFAAATGIAAAIFALVFLASWTLARRRGAKGS